MITFLEACKCGNLEIVKLMIEKGATDWNWGMVNACGCGHFEIVKLMIEKGATDWDWGMGRACEGGHLEIAKLMIEKGAHDWNWGMRYACEGGHLEIVKLMIKKGATKWELLSQNRSKGLVSSLSFSESKKFVKMKVIPLNVRKIIRKRLYFFSQIYENMFCLFNNMFPVLKLFFKN